MRTIALTIAVAAAALVAAGAPRADAQAPDVPTADYDLGVRRFVEPGATGRFARIPIRLWGAVAVPAGSGPAPVVVVGHGSHGDGCPGEFGDWPCFGVEQRNDLGLRYLVRQLARVGFVAVAPDVNASFTGGFGETQDHEYRRYAEVVDATLEALRTASAGGPNRFSVPLQGRVDPTRIGVIGHSRGGRNLLRWAAANRPAVGAIVLLAPLFDRSVAVPDVPTALLLGTCDDDTGRTGAGYLAAARRSAGRTQPFWSLTMRGANHNFYNRTLVRLRDDDAAGARGRCARSRRPKATGQQAFLVRIAWDHLTRALLAAPAAPWQLSGARSGSLYGQRVTLSTDRVG